MPNIWIQSFDQKLQHWRFFLWFLIWALKLYKKYIHLFVLLIIWLSDYMTEMTTSYRKFENFHLKSVASYSNK